MMPHQGQSMPRIAQLLAGVTAVCLASADSVLAQPFPAKPIRIVVPFSAGGPSDFTARVISQRLPELLGQPVIIDNRPGAAGAIAAELVAKSPSDGHTLLIVNSGIMLAPYLFSGKLAYDPARDFAPIANLIGGPQWLVTHPSVPARSVKQLIELARARPGQLHYGSAGVGQQSHLTGELFKIMTGVDILHVPYKGAAPAVADMIGGHISMNFTALLAVVLPQAKAGRLHLLAVTSLKRSPATPEVPTMDESGLKGFEVSNWNGILAPAGTPQDVIGRLNRDIVKALQFPEVREAISAQGNFVIGDTPDEFGAFNRADSLKWSRLIKQLGIQLN